MYIDFIQFFLNFELFLYNYNNYPDKSFDFQEICDIIF